MADTLKVLAQANPAAATLTDLYVVPAATSAMVSSVVICNPTSAALTFRVAVAVAGATDTAKQYLYYDESVNPNKSFVATIGLTLAATDVLRVQANSPSASFNAFGIEVT